MSKQHRMRSIKEITGIRKPSPLDGPLWSQIDPLQWDYITRKTWDKLLYIVYQRSPLIKYFLCWCLCACIRICACLYLYLCVLVFVFIFFCVDMTGEIEQHSNHRCDKSTDSAHTCNLINMQMLS